MGKDLKRCIMLTMVAGVVVYIIADAVLENPHTENNEIAFDDVMFDENKDDMGLDELDNMNPEDLEALKKELVEKALAGEEISMKKAMKSGAVTVKYRNGVALSYELLFHELQYNLEWVLNNVEAKIDGSDEKVPFKELSSEGNDVVASLGKVTEEERANFLADRGFRFPLRGAMKSGRVEAKLIGPDGKLGKNLSYEEVLALAEECDYDHLWEKISLYSGRCCWEIILPYFDKSFDELYVCPLFKGRGSNHPNVNNNVYDLEAALSTTQGGVNTVYIRHPKYGHIFDFKKFLKLYKEEGDEFINDAVLSAWGHEHSLKDSIVGIVDNIVYVQDIYLYDYVYENAVANDKYIDLREAINQGYIRIYDFGGARMFYDEFCELFAVDGLDVFNHLTIVSHKTAANGDVSSPECEFNAYHYRGNGDISVKVHHLSKEEIATLHAQRGQYFDLGDAIRAGVVIVSSSMSENGGILTEQDFAQLYSTYGEALLNNLAIFTPDMKVLEVKFSPNDEGVDVKIQNPKVLVDSYSGKGINF